MVAKDSYLICDNCGEWWVLRRPVTQIECPLQEFMNCKMRISIMPPLPPTDRTILQTEMPKACSYADRDPLLQEREKTHDMINHPPHYTKHPSGVECIQITEHMNFNLGNAVKYIWRAGDKGNMLEDLKKARWYLDREIMRLS